MAHFIVAGTCLVIEKLMVRELKTYKKNQVKFALAEPDTPFGTPGVECVFMKTCQLTQEAVFGIGTI